MIAFTIALNAEEYVACADFARKSAPTQREHRSGGAKVRSIAEIEEDTLRGKVGEVAAKKFLEQEPLRVPGIALDFNIYSRGKWDQADFIIFGKKFAIKSAKHFSSRLMIETKDIRRGDLYDYYVLVTVAQDNKSGTVKGFATQDEILNDVNTIKCNQGELIPGTGTLLDAANHIRHQKYLHNTAEDWERLISGLRDNAR